MSAEQLVALAPHVPGLGIDGSRSGLGPGGGLALGFGERGVVHPLGEDLPFASPFSSQRPRGDERMNPGYAHRRRFVRSCVAALVYVYDHETRQLSKRLMTDHHSHADMSIATLHVHMDEATCLEVSLLKGQKSDVEHFAGHVIGALILAVDERWPDLHMGVHMALWPVLTLVLCLWLLPIAKGGLVAYQWAMRMHGFEAAPAQNNKKQESALA